MGPLSNAALTCLTLPQQSERTALVKDPAEKHRRIFRFSSGHLRPAPANMPPVPTIRRDDAESRGPENAVDGALGDRPALPYAKAFVVQFSYETDAGLKRATGRVEHLQSGRRAAFASPVGLLACLVAMLGDEQAKPPKATGRRSGGRGSKGAPGRGAKSTSR